MHVHSETLCKLYVGNEKEVRKGESNLLKPGYSDTVNYSNATEARQLREWDEYQPRHGMVSGKLFKVLTR